MNTKLNIGSNRNYIQKLKDKFPFQYMFICSNMNESLFKHFDSKVKYEKKTCRKKFKW